MDKCVQTNSINLNKSIMTEPEEIQIMIANQLASNIEIISTMSEKLEEKNNELEFKDMEIFKLTEQKSLFESK